jgi:hypothetical protein
MFRTCEEIFTRLPDDAAHAHDDRYESTDHDPRHREPDPALPVQPDPAGRDQPEA